MVRPRCITQVITQDDPSPIVIRTDTKVEVIVGGGGSQGPPDAGGSSNVVKVKLGPGNWATYQPFRLLSGVAVPITSLDVAMPLCDGILLESGSEGQTVTAAMQATTLNNGPLPLPGSDGALLWLGQLPGPLVSVVPSRANGDVWSLPVGRKAGPSSLIYDSSLPIQL